MKTKILLNKLSKLFPKKYAKANHDFVGLMTGKLPEEVNKILLCLDMDEEIFDQVKEVKPDIVISHHPFIFGTRYRVFKYDPAKKDLSDRLDALNIPVYSFHTNFDTGKGGMNDALSDALGLKEVYAPAKNNMMRIGTLPKEMDVKEFSLFAKSRFNIGYSLLVDSGNKIIKKVGIIGGGGSRSWQIAKDEGCDIYISGDAPHYVRRDIVLNKFNYLDMPHEIEHIFMDRMESIIKGFDPSIEIIKIDHEKIPKVI